jgi:hypothetical protein
VRSLAWSARLLNFSVIVASSAWLGPNPAKRYAGSLSICLCSSIRGCMSIFCPFQPRLRFACERTAHYARKFAGLPRGQKLAYALAKPSVLLDRIRLRAGRLPQHPLVRPSPLPHAAQVAAASLAFSQEPIARGDHTLMQRGGPADDSSPAVLASRSRPSTWCKPGWSLRWPLIRLPWVEVLVGQSPFLAV